MMAATAGSQKGWLWCMATHVDRIVSMIATVMSRRYLSPFVFA